MSKVTPYKTPSRLQIGLTYQPPQRNNNTKEDEFWQGILLGVEPTYTRRKAFYWAMYIVTLMAVFFAFSFIKE